MNKTILAILNQKGGVGKTTTAITLAHGLARRGLSTLLVDLDAQGNVADALGLRKGNGEGLYHLLIDAAGSAAVVSSTRPNLHVIVGGKRTVEARQILAGQPFREMVLARALAALDYAYIILDVAPGVDLLQISALVAASHFIIPVALDHLAVVGAFDALTSAAALKQAGGLGAQLMGILPTFWERTTNESHQQLRIMAAQFRRLVWPPIPADVKAREAPAHGQTLWEYAPTCRALTGVKLNGNGIITGGYQQAVERFLQEVAR